MYPSLVTSTTPSVEQVQRPVRPSRACVCFVERLPVAFDRQAGGVECTSGGETTGSFVVAQDVEFSR